MACLIESLKIHIAMVVPTNFSSIQHMVMGEMSFEKFQDDCLGIE